MRATDVVCVLLAATAVAFADSGDVVHFNYNPADPTRASASDDYAKRLTVEGENADVAMAAEEVTITLYPDYADVDAVFDFKNTASRPVRAEMGFPLDAGALDVVGGNDALWGELSALQERNDGEARKQLDGASLTTNLTVTVDDRPAAIDIRNAVAVAEYSYRDITATATWPVDFDAGATRRVRCRYRNDYTRHQGTDSVIYTILTGATWRGPIGYGKLVVRPAPGFKHWDGGLFFITQGMPAPTAAADTVVWEFRDLEPPSGTRTNLPECDYLSLHQGDLAKVGAGLLVGFTPKDYANPDSHSDLPSEEGVPAWALVDGLNFREGPDANADRIAAKPAFNLRDPFLVVGRRGDWYRVRCLAGEEVAGQGMSLIPGGVLEGWVRWRYVDPDSREERIYVDIVAHGLL